MGLCLLTEQKSSLEIIPGLPSRPHRRVPFRMVLQESRLGFALNVNREPEWEFEVASKTR